MCAYLRSGVLAAGVLAAGVCFAQEPVPAPLPATPGQTEPAAANPTQDRSDQNRLGQNGPAQNGPAQNGPVQSVPDQNIPTQTSTTQAKPPADPQIIEDGGLSIEPIYWLNRQQPTLKAGATALVPGNFDYSGQAKYSLGGEIGIPAGRANTLRFSYFRVLGNSNATLAAPQTIFSESFNAGDYMSGGYRLQSAKISWDYLSYTWYKHSTKIRFKTLYELQYVTISTTLVAPFKPITTDASGNEDDNLANGSKNLFSPSLGGEFEGEWGKHLRWELKASGFGLPHWANIGDAQGLIAVRVGDAVEIMAGERVFHFKNSAKGDQYFADTLQGAFVGVRYYWGKRQ
jgi:hypothetical protein